MDKPWNNKSVKQAIKDSLNEDYFFKMEDLDEITFLLTNKYETPQTFLVQVTELEPEEIKYFKTIKEDREKLIKVIHNELKGTL